MCCYCKLNCLNSLSGSSLLVYRSTADFCVLILYLTILLNSFISSKLFCGILGFSTYKIISSANRDNFTFSFLIWMSVVNFSCLIALASTSYTMLNRSGESRHSHLVHERRGKVFQSFTIEYAVTCGIFIYGLDYIQVVSFYP